MSLLDGYKADNPGALRQTYAGRPASLFPPSGFVDAINEPNILITAGPTQREPSIELILIQGLFDSEEAVNNQDALVDGFIDYIRSHIHASGASTLIANSVSTTDIPNYQPDWILDAPIYYASRVTLGGVKLEGGVI